MSQEKEFIAKLLRHERYIHHSPLYVADSRLSRLFSGGVALCGGGAMDSELAFRAKLVVHDHCRLYDYWRKQAGGNLVPSRKDIDPAAIRHLLPHVCLIDIENGIDDAVFRLAGTRIRDIYGFEITGTSLSEMDWGARAIYWDAIYQYIVDECAPMQGVVRGPVAQREHVTAFWLRLPLSDDGSRVNKILCHDIPTANNDLVTSATTVNRVA